MSDSRDSYYPFGSKLEKLFFDIVLWGLIIGTILFFVVVLPFVVHESNRERKEHAEFCESKGMTSQVEIVSHGKFSESNYFCYDKNGQVFYYGR